MGTRNYARNCADNMKKFRKDKKWSQTVMAEKIRVSRTTLGDYEKGKTCPNIDVVAQIADVFEISLDELIGRIVDLSNYDLCMLKHNLADIKNIAGKLEEHVEKLCKK